MKPREFLGVFVFFGLLVWLIVAVTHRGDDPAASSFDMEHAAARARDEARPVKVAEEPEPSPSEPSPSVPVAYKTAHDEALARVPDSWKYAVRLYYRHIDDLREKKGPRYAVMSRANPKELKTLLGETSDQLAMRIAIERGAAIGGYAGIVWCVNQFGYGGIAICADSADTARLLPELLPSDVETARLTEGVRLEIDWIQVTNESLGPVFQGVLRNTSADVSYGFVDVRFQIRDRNKVLREDAYDSRSEGLPPKERWAFKATAYGERIAPTSTFEIEVDGQ